MGSLLILTVAVVSALCGLSQSCSPCPFEWMESRNYCYRYFPENLSYDEADMFCKQFSHTGHVAELATVTSLEELTLFMDYLDKVFVNVPSGEAPKKVWLRNNTQKRPDVVPILHRTMGPLESHVVSCDSVEVSGDWFKLAGDTNLIQIVPAPDVVDHACAVYAHTGSYLDLGDFKDTCISDPGLCESMTWSLWLNINTSSGFTGERYYITSGGQTHMARGIFVAYVNNMFTYGLKTSNVFYSKSYETSKIPLNKWFHLALSFAGVNTQIFVDGEPVSHGSHSTQSVGSPDVCTKLFMGHSSTCIDSYLYSPRTLGGSAAYSDLTVFDGLLNQQQIRYIYSCGSHEWNLMVRSLVMKSDLEFECTASDPSGPIITWSVYHNQTDSWENLDASGDGYTVQSVNVSTCVVRSTLVMSSSQVSPTAIACKALARSNNASLFLYRGRNMTFNFSDQKHAEWNLMVRSLVMKSDLEFECTASDPSGPIITWSVYHKQTDSWENLDASGDGYTIRSVSVSTCVVRSTLVMSSSQVTPTAIACTAQAGSNNASVFLYRGRNMTFNFSDQKHAGISLLAEGSTGHYTHKYGYQEEGSSTVDHPEHPFICKIPDKKH